MILSLVTLLTPAYATNEIEVDFDPNTLVTSISWDFGNNPDRESCVSFSKADFDPYRDGILYNTPTKQWDGLNYQDATTQSSSNGLIDPYTNSDSVIDCIGNFTFSQYDVHAPSSAMVKDYATRLIMSFGEILNDGSGIGLNEAITFIDTNRVHTHTSNCDFSTIEKTTFIEVFPYTATQYEEVVIDDNTCTTTETDLTMEPQYIMFFNMLWNDWAIP